MHYFKADAKPILLQADYKEVKAYFDSALPVYFDYDFSYVPEEIAHFREIDRFLWESRHLMTRFQNKYSGPAVIGLTAWNHDPLNMYFEAFMYFLQDFGLQNELHFYVEEEISEELYQGLGKHFNVRLQSRTLNLNTSTKHPIGFIEREEL